MSSTHFFVEVGRPSLQGPCIYLPFPSRQGWKVVIYIYFFFTIHAHTVDITRMTLQLGLIRMLMWHHGGMIRGTWNVLAACWRALDECQHIQAHGEHMKTREKEGRHPPTRGST